MLVKEITNNAKDNNLLNPISHGGGQNLPAQTDKAKFIIFIFEKINKKTYLVQILVYPTNPNNITMLSQYSVYTQHEYIISVNVP